MLRAYVSNKQTQWEQYLPLLEFAYNDRKHSSTGLSPFELTYGYRPKSPLSIGIPQKVPSAAEFLIRMQQMSELAKANITRALDRMKTYTDQNRTPREFEVGAKVFLQVPTNSTSLATGACAKVSPRYCGPWNIIKKISDVAYKLELPEKCKVHPVFHVSRLKNYLHDGDNLVEGIVSLQEQGAVAHGPDRILDQRIRRLRSRLLREYLVTWRGLPLSDATWETEHRLRSDFPEFHIEDDAS